MFSILIPTWNNLAYLKMCVRSIRDHSAWDHQIIVIVNEGIDGTVEWLDAEDITFVHHTTNVGICKALNSATPYIQMDHMVYLNDDMYTLPGWDIKLYEEIERVGYDRFMLSSTMIEPSDTGNACVIVQDFGSDLKSFDQQSLLNFHESTHKDDWSGSSWPPVMMPTKLWKEVGGMSEEFSPGMYSDPDLSMKLWEHGVRYFKGLGESRVYHFGSKSTRKLGKNLGRKLFLSKWGITANYFYTNFLKMGEPWSGELPDHRESPLSKVIHQLKKIK